MVLIKDGLIALRNTVAHIDELRRLRPPAQAIGGAILTDPRIPLLLHDLCSQLGQACQLIFDTGPNRGKELPADGEARRERAAFVRNACSGIDIGSLTDRRARNLLVHIDEHLLKQGRAHKGDWLVDMAISSRALMTTPDGGFAYCRVYVSDEDKLYHLGSELNLAAVEMAAIKVLERFELDDQD
jgi:hypothetical protein